jgi:putative transposase
VTEVLPILYLHGLSTGDFGPALRDLLGEDASGLSPSSIQRLTESWQVEHAAFRAWELRFHRYAYWFVDGVHVSVRLGEDDRLCLLVVIGVREDGTKELLAVEDGYRETTESWAGVMRDLKARGANEPKLVIGDGALGTWAALRDVYPGARRQACWVHAIANVLDCLPKRLQPRAKTMLHEIMEAPTRAEAAQALERFRDEFTAKYPKALAKLDRDWKHLTAFYDFPAEHWRHLRTSNAIESSFATVQLRTRVTKGAAPSRPRSRWPTALGRRPGTLATVQRPRARHRRARSVNYKDGIKVTDDDNNDNEMTDERVAA